MIEPLAPLYPWLRDALGHQVVRWSAGLPRFASSHYPTPYEIDLRDLQTRAAVLRALADAGHSRPWALGVPWSPLTDEQAGRAAAAILRAIGEDPSKPVGVVPVCVAGRWEASITFDQWFRYRVSGGRGHCAMVHVHSDGWRVDVNIGPDPLRARGPEIGDAGRRAADNAARSMGCLMIEELTP